MKNRYMKGLTPLPDHRYKSSDSVISMSDANYKKCTSSKWFILGDDGKARLKSGAELEADKVASSKESARKEAKEARDEALRNCTVEVNGNVFQTRPSDEVNFRLAIAGMADGENEEWILSDNAVAEVSKADLIEAYSLGLQASKVIFATYKETLK